jgi:hypothetical protein
VYVYRRDSEDWVEEAILTASDGELGDAFGFDLALSVEYLFVGTFSVANEDGTRGAVYVFRDEGGFWNELAKLTPPDDRAMWFGRAVAADGDVLVVGAAGDDGGAGAAYVYRRDGDAWNYAQRLTASEATPYDRFGTSLAMDGDRIVIGAPTHPGEESNSGEAYVFEPDGGQWVERARLAPNDVRTGDEFGHLVAVSGDRIAVAAVSGDIFGRAPGSVYLFERDGDGWAQVERYTATDGSNGKLFGDALALGAQDVFVGARWDSPPDQKDRGAIYSYALRDCNANGREDRCDIQQCASTDCNGDEIPDECQETPPSDETQLLASDAEAYDEFATAVAIRGAWAVVGAWRDDDYGNDSGAAYIFQFANGEWTEAARVTASDASDSGWFGQSVAIEGDVIIVGAPGATVGNARPGAAYIFRYDGADWIEEQKLSAPDGVGGDWFGYSVAISGNCVVAGAFHNVNDAAYIFEYDGAQWNQIAKLTASDGGDNDGFGQSVAISGRNVLVGAYYKIIDPNYYCGAAYLFHDEDGEWREQRLTPADPYSWDEFGWAVALDGDLALISAPFKDGWTGAVYAFRRVADDWIEEAKLIPADQRANDEFGWSVAVHRDTAAVGAIHHHDGDGYDDGGAYLFRYEGGAWQERAAFPAPRETSWAFGISVGVDRAQVIIGSNLDDAADRDAGAAYIYTTGFVECTEPDCDSNGSSDRCDIARGEAADCNWNGIPDSCDIRDGISADCNHNDIPDECELAAQPAQKLTGSDSALNDHFGWSIATDGDVAVIGAPEVDGADYNTGAAYVFRFDGAAWTQESSLTPDEGQDSDNFGYSVAVSGDWAAIGAPDTDYRGVVEVFHHAARSWTHFATLELAERVLLDRFGYAVALDGDVLVVGAPCRDVNGCEEDFNDPFKCNHGAAYVYRFDGAAWALEAELVASDAVDYDRIATSVAIQGDRVLVGAPYRGATTGEPEAVYIFRYASGEWFEEALLVPDDGERDDLFGYAVSLDGVRALIGAPLWDAEGCEEDWQDPHCAQGAAYVFRLTRNGWQQDARLAAPDAQPLDLFGASAAIRDDRILVGALGDDEALADTGSAYVFARGESQRDWLFEGKLVAADRISGQDFGRSLAFSDHGLWVGASYDDDRGSAAGAAYVFPTAFPDCNGNTVPDDCDIASGTSRDANADGVPDECQYPRGDLNCDGAVDFDDIDPFVLALINRDEYEAQFPRCNYDNADINGDSSVDFDDIDPFVVCLINGGCP